MRFIAQIEGRTLDVTEQVRMMYDGLVNSMDWGSEFLDTETKGAILAIGRLLGAPTPMPPVGAERVAAKEAGFYEPAPDLWGQRNEPCTQEALDKYKAWKDRRNAALLKWHAEVAAQEAAKLEEIDL